MKNLYVICLIFVLGCSKAEKLTNGTNGHNSLIKTVTNNPNCVNGGYLLLSGLDLNDNGILDSNEIASTADVCNGANGITGAAGSSGTNGHNSLIKIISTNTCQNGGFTLLTGIDLNGNGTLETSEAASSAQVCNGNNGKDASVPDFTPVAIITPCGPHSSAYKEVLLGLAGGSIFAEFTADAHNAATVRNTLIPDGYYYDTDDSYCQFTVSSDSNGNRSINWSGAASNSQWPAGGVIYDSITKRWINN